jgi:hypothetical protein
LTRPLIDRADATEGSSDRAAAKRRLAEPAVPGQVEALEQAGYTVLGATVNVAARLETRNKEHGIEILVGGARLRIGRV